MFTLSGYTVAPAAPAENLQRFGADIAHDMRNDLCFDVFSPFFKV